MSIIDVSPLYSCYDSIIGLSRTACTCEDPKGEFVFSYNESYSGLFIDELEPLNILASLKYCEDDVWEILDRARENAIKNFVSDGTRELLKFNKLRTQPFTGVIGRRTNTRDRALTTTYAGVHIICKRIKGGEMTLNNLDVCMNYTGNLAVFLVDNLDNPTIANSLWNSTFAVVADTWTRISVQTTPAPGNDPEDIVLPLWDERVDNVEYFLVYERTQFNASGQPRNNDVCCNCSKSLSFNANRPYYLRGHDDAYRWADSIMVGGFDTDDITRFDDVTFDYGGSNFLNGINMDIEMNCDIGLVLCDTTLNFVSDPLAIAIAYAILYKSAELLANTLMSSKQQSYTSLINKENLAREQLVWATKYRELIDYIGLNTDITLTDCLVCKDDWRIEQSTIFS